MRRACTVAGYEQIEASANKAAYTITSNGASHPDTALLAHSVADQLQAMSLE